jgi:translation initiation factor 3 subunit E
MAEYDLTAKLGRYFDRHLVFPLLEFLTERNIFDEKEILQAKYDLLQHTTMVDFQLDIYNKLHLDGNEPKELIDKREAIVSRFNELSQAVQPLLDAVVTEDATRLIEHQRNSDSILALDFLQKKFNIERSIVDDLYTFARYVYDCGDYSRAATNLGLYRALVPNSDKNMMSCLWGKLASEILMQRWDDAYDDLNHLKDAIETNNSRLPLELLHQRTWFIHWSLFVYFNHPKGRDDLVQLFLGSNTSTGNQTNTYLNTLQTTAPHLLRYLTAAVIINPRKKNERTLKELVKVIQQESYAFRDPITEFLECLYVHFDFDGAQQKLRDCTAVLNNDFFLIGCAEEFMENARLLIFETFCRIHHCITIDMLAEKLNMGTEEAERWIVNLIRNASLDAKIDSQKGVVVMGSQALSPYQTIIEKTKNLFNRTQSLAQNSEKKRDTNANWSNYQTQQSQTNSGIIPLIE